MTAFAASTSIGKYTLAPGEHPEGYGIDALWAFSRRLHVIAPHGLDVRSYGSMLDQMAALGFNTIRLPYSNQLFDAGSAPTGINYALNPDLRGLRGLALLDKIVAGAGQRGLKVILDQHRPDAYAQSDLWYTAQVPEARWIGDWAMLARHYRGDATVIGPTTCSNRPAASRTGTLSCTIERRTARAIWPI